MAVSYRKDAQPNRYTRMCLDDPSLYQVFCNQCTFGEHPRCPAGVPLHDPVDSFDFDSQEQFKAVQERMRQSRSQGQSPEANSELR